MSSYGISRLGGESLEGFPHVQQSIGVILTTPIETRVMRREFGSEIMDLIDRPMTPRVILAIYAATAQAIARWEPRFEVKACVLARATPEGVLQLQITGIYYPRGHLGDRTPDSLERQMIIPLARAA